MVYNLVIVESPAKTGTFEKILGPGYKCMASFGHIRELKSLADVNKENNYLPTFRVCSSKSKQIHKLQEAAKSANQVLLATDDDREGEAIAWHLCKVLKINPLTCPRLIFHEITPSAIHNAIRNPTVIDINKVQAQQARQVLDMLVGYQVSPLLWRQFGGQLLLSAGRCQTPALRLVYENEKQIKECPGTIAYTTTGIFTQKSITFTLNKQYDSENDIANFLKTTINSQHKHMLNIEKESTTKKNQPIPFTTSSLQQSANSEFHISPKEAMMICQKLYEAGLITYMRTDSRTYSKEFIETAKSFISSKYGANNINPNINCLTERSVTINKQKDKKTNSKKNVKDGNTQEAHEAIRPTKITTTTLDNSKYSPKERKMYQMIWRNTVESCMTYCQCKTVSAYITAPNDLQYRVNQEEVIEPGWKLVSGYDKINMCYRYLVATKKSCPLEVNYAKINSRLGTKDTKSHFTEAKLVQLLEDKGIGRPSTFSSLVDKIQERGYVKREDVEGKLHKGIEFELIGKELSEINVEKKFGGEKNKLVLQPLGEMVWQYLQESCLPLFEYEFTKHMEEQLDIIAHGNLTWYKLCEDCDKEICDCVSKLSIDRVNSKCIKIDEQHEYTITKYGPVVVSIIDGKKVYQSAKKNIDLEQLRSGNLSVEDIVDETKKDGGVNLGEHDKIKVILKNGKYGMYVQWGDKNISVKRVGKRETDITLSKVIPLLEASKEPVKFRKLNEEYSVRIGKSPYIFYKTDKMKKPKFINLKGFDENPFTCELQILLAWMETKHKIKI